MYAPYGSSSAHDGFLGLAILVQVRRKDWAESMTHHVATVILLVYAYYVNFARVGTMVLLVHDVSDIFLESAKLARWVLT